MSTKLDFSPKPENLKDIFQNMEDLFSPLSKQDKRQLALISGEASINYGTDIPGGKVTFDLGVKGNAGIDVYNSENDDDPDGVYSGKAPETTTRETSPGRFEEVKLPPTLRFTDGATAWTKFYVNAKPSLKVNVELPASIGVKFDASKTAVLANYRKHPSAKQIGEALVADMADLRIATDVDHILSLPEGDALFYNVRGVLDTTVTLKWSDSFGFAISDLSRFLGKGQTLAVDIGASVEVDFHVFLRDDFRLVFTRNTDNRTRVAVKKAKSQELGVGVNAGIEVGLANPDQLSAALGTLFNSLVGKDIALIDNAIAKIDEMVQKATFADLSEEERQIAKLLADRLGLSPITGAIEDLAAQWEQIKAKWAKIKSIVPDLIKQAVNFKVGLSFKYEYLRLSVEDELAVALLTENSLRAAHEDLMFLSLNNLLDEARKDGNELETYINQKITTKRQAWGFTLNLGKWTFTGQDSREVKTSLQTNKDGLKRIAFDTLRSYKDTSAPEENLWIVNLKAEMGNFAAKLDHKTLDYGLHIKTYALEKEVDSGEMRTFLDQALLFETLTVQGLPQVERDTDPGGGTRAQMTAEITIGNSELRQLVRMIRALSNDDRNSRMAKAFAKALPYDKGLGTFRVAPANRAKFYTGLWEKCLENSALGGNTLRNMVASTLDGFDSVRAQLERQVHFPTFARQVELHTGAAASIKAFFKGIDKLFVLFNEDQPGEFGSEEFVSAFKSLRDLWDQILYVRAMVAFLLDVARQDPALYAGIKRTSTITLGTGDGAKTTLLSAGA